MLGGKDEGEREGSPLAVVLAKSNNGEESRFRCRSSLVVNVLGQSCGGVVARTASTYFPCAFFKRCIVCIGYAAFLDVLQKRSA